MNGFIVAIDTFTGMVIIPVHVRTGFMYEATGCVPHMDITGEEDIGGKPKCADMRMCRYANAWEVQFAHL